MRKLSLVLALSLCALSAETTQGGGGGGFKHP